MNSLIAIYNPQDVTLTINGEAIQNIDLTLCNCGEESDFGAHGIRNGKVYSEYYCKDCYNKKEAV
jgi:hypothetical protein